MITLTNPFPEEPARDHLLSACPVGNRSDDELAADLTTLAARLSAVEYRFLVLLAEFDRRRPWAGDGIRSTAHWLNVRCGIAMGTAHEKVRVAQALVTLPKIAAAMARGQVGYSKVRAMTRVATAENEESLVGAARFGTAAHLDKLVRLHRRCERQRANRAAAESEAARSFRYWKYADGTVRFEGRLPAAEGALFLKAFESAHDSLRREDSPSGESAKVSDPDPVRVPPEGESAATSEPATPAESPVESRRVPEEDPARREARNADALMVLAETMLAHGRAAVDGGDRYEVSIYVNESALPRDGEGPPAELADGTVLAPETVRRIACDCSRVCVHEGEDGEILSVGRRTRQIPPAIRRALKARDRTCAFPGCKQSRFVDAHHVRHWADGGETKLSNLVLLCRRHHVLVHEGGWRIEATDFGAVFVRGDGVRLQGAELGGDELLDVLAEVEREQREVGLKIAARTILPEWRGERILWSWAVDNLQDRTHGGCA